MLDHIFNCSEVKKEISVIHTIHFGYLRFNYIKDARLYAVNVIPYTVFLLILKLHQFCR